MTGWFRDGGGGGCRKDVGRDVPVFFSGFAGQLARNWSWERFDVGVDQHDRSWYRFNMWAEPETCFTLAGVESFSYSHFVEP